MFQKALDLVFGFFVVLVILWFVWEAGDWSFHSRLFPWSIGLTVLVLALVQLALSVRKFQVSSSDDDAELKDSLQSRRADEVETGSRGSNAWRVATIGCWIAVFFLGIWLLGFRVGSLILTIAFLKLAAKEPRKECLILGVVNYVFFLIIFDFALGVPLFQGVIAQWLRIESLDVFILKELIRSWS